MIKAIIFDFFGVIRTDAYEAWLASHGLKKEGDYLEISRLQDVGDISNEEFYERLSKLFGSRVTRKDFDATAKIHHDTLQLITALKKHYAIAVLSNSPLGLLRGIIKDNNLEKYFDEIIISSEVNLVKPSPEIFTYTLRKLGVKPQETIFIDDNSKHVEAAQKADIQGFQFVSAARLGEDLRRLGLQF